MAGEVKLVSEGAGLLLCQAAQVDITLGPEMKSTGEVMGRDRDYARAVYKGLWPPASQMPRFGTVIATIGDKEKEEALPLDETFL